MDPDITPQRPTVSATDLTLVGRPKVQPGSSHPCLVLVSAARAETIGKALRLDRDEIEIGRGIEATFRIDDPGISRLHAHLAKGPDGRWTARDLGSTNGTYLNGHRIDSALLSPGDRLQLGGVTTLRFSLQDQLEDDEERLRRALIAAGVGTWEWEPTTGAFVLSETAERLLWGRTTPAQGVRDLWLMVHNDDRAALREGLERAAATRSSYEGECRLRAPIGLRWVSLRGESFRDQTGRTIRLAGTLMDITERKRAEEDLRRQALMFESLSDGVVMLDVNGRVLDWNAAARRLFGWTREEALGRVPDELLLPEHSREGLSLPMLAAVAAGGRWSREVELRRKHGGTCLAEVVAVPLSDADGRQFGCIAVLRDIGERRELDARLQLAERLSSLGTLAAGMAHEINNPLAFILSNVEFVLEQLGSPKADGAAASAELLSSLRDARQGAERIRVLVRDLGVFSRGRGQEKVGPVDVNSSLEFAARIAGNEFKHRARLVRKLGEVPPAQANEAQLGQVFLNLIVNAAQAIRPGDVAGNEVRLSSRWDAVRERIVVEVGDTGAGIPEADLPRVFEPFFTTKLLAGGTGLGLSICHRAITELGGSIRVESRVGHGTVFELLLPAAPRAQVLPAPSIALLPAGRGRVLIVDDEELVGAAARRLLEDHHEVVVLGRAAEVLELLGAGQRFDAILCDLMMPEMTGIDLHTKLMQELPELGRRLVFMTGGAITESSQKALEAAGRPCVAKPFNVDELLAAMAQAVSGQ